MRRRWIVVGGEEARWWVRVWRGWVKGEVPGGQGRMGRKFMEVAEGRGRRLVRSKVWQKGWGMGGWGKPGVVAGLRSAGGGAVEVSAWMKRVGSV